MALTIGGYASIVLGLLWAMYFAASQMWLLSVLDLIFAVFGLLVMMLANKGHARAAMIVLLVSMFFLVSAMCLFLDIPTPAATRSVHHYFLVLACLSILFFQADKAALKYGVPAILVITYIIFASSALGIVTSYALPDSIRVMGTWVNNSIAMILVYIILYFMFSDIYVPTQTEQDLCIAIYDNQLELYYQPQVDQYGNIWGAEALLR